MCRVVTTILLAALAACQGRDAPGPAPPAPTVLATPTAADPPKPIAPRSVLVELFTSQGCSSCPPADALLGELPALGFPGDQVVALSYHVTYWDDLGWTDPFGDESHDARQLGYARKVPAASDERGRSMQGPYTPQMVVDGQIHFVGSLADVAREQITAARARPPVISLSASGTLSAERSSRSISLDVDSGAWAGEGEPSRALGLLVALAQRRVTTEVPRGENAGKQLQEHGVVRQLAGPRPLKFERPETTRFKVPVPADLPADELMVVVFVQDLATLAVLATTTAAIS